MKLNMKPVPPGSAPVSYSRPIPRTYGNMDMDMGPYR
jgi:hypothetical protein